MNLITKNNYEAFLLDYVEGNLSPEHTAELMLFFENNPSLKEDLDDFEILTLTPPALEMDKEELKIEESIVSLATFEDAIIAEIEDENTAEQSAALFLFLKENPSKKHELVAYQKTILDAPAIVFTDKKGLKQKDTKVIPLYWWYSSAAAIILAVFLLKGIYSNNEVSSPFVANEIENTKTIKEEQQVNKAILIAVEEEQEINEELEKPVIDLVKQTTVNKVAVKNGVQKNAEEEIDEVIFANKQIKEVELKDTIEMNKLLPQKVVPVKEEVLYANNVKIVYEDEPVGKNEAVDKPGKKLTKFDAVRAAIKQQVREKFLNKKNTEVVLAYSAESPISIRKSKKNKK